MTAKKFVSTFSCKTHNKCDFTINHDFSNRRATHTATANGNNCKGKESSNKAAQSLDRHRSRDDETASATSNRSI